jgi:hypothetical protein
MQQVTASPHATIPAPAAGPRPPRLLERLLEALRSHDCSLATEQAYVSWAERYVRFHRMRHPRDLGEAEVASFLSHLARDLDAPAPERSQAFAALVFLYREVLQRDLDWRRVAARRVRPHSDAAARDAPAGGGL